MLLYEDHKAVVYAVAFSPDGATFASGAKDGSLILRGPDGRTRQLLEQGPFTPAVHAIAHLADGGIVIGHAKGWYVYRRDEAVEPVSTPPTTALAVLDRNTLVVGTGDRRNPTAGTLELWDLGTGKKLEPQFQEPNGVRTVTACPARNLVAWATGHRQVKVWDIRKQQPLVLPQTHTSPAVALSADGSLLAVAVDWAVKIFDVASRRERVTLKGHKGLTSAVAFSPDGATLATGSWDQTVRLWEVGSGREQVNFRWPIGKVFSLTYAPDGLRLAAGGDHGMVVVWDLE